MRLVVGSGTNAKSNEMSSKNNATDSKRSAIDSGVHVAVGARSCRELH